MDGMELFKKLAQCEDKEQMQRVIEAHNESQKPQTNADRIRAMSDEELAAWARRQIGCGSDYFPCGIVCDGKCNSFDDETCQAKIMDYLKQPVKGN